jgi:hypothetical protein
VLDTDVDTPVMIRQTLGAKAIVTGRVELPFGEGHRCAITTDSAWSSRELVDPLQ